MDTCDTIVALASGKGTGGVAVVRVSGPDARGCIEGLTGKATPEARRAVVRTLHDETTGEVLDRALVLWFPGPNSYTGEDSAEFHVHGGRAVVGAVIGALLARPRCRLAERGEFTRRAFDHGRMDLPAAEAVADLVAAETSVQRRQAVRLAEGAASRVFEDWRERLLGVQARWEAVIDFSDEDLPDGLVASARDTARKVAAEIGAHLAKRTGERIRDGLRVAIVGAPNVGKSSLLNRLAERDAAIVSETAGTTRDVIEVRMELGGYAVLLADTAGLRATEDAIESEGVRRARRWAEEADIRIAMFDATRWPEIDEETAALVDDRTVVVVNKADLKDPGDGPTVRGIAGERISAKGGDGVERLVGRLTGLAEGAFDGGDEAIVTRARQRRCLEDCVAGLSAFGRQAAVELAGEDLRAAISALGRLTGRVGVEDMLDRVFAEFCIGK